jgi:transcriptional regulator with XRE-family HTH domain
MTTSDDPAVDDLRLRLRTVMAEGGFTQTDVAKTIGLSQSVVSRFLRDGMKNPPLDTLNRIRAFLGDDLHEDVLSHEDVRRAVRLYRYVRNTLDSGSNILVRDPDGTEQMIVFLW